MDAEELSLLFDTCNKSGSGFLNRTEFEMICEELGLGKAVLTQLFDSLDINRNGVIERQEFMDKFHQVADSTSPPASDVIELDGPRDDDDDDVTETNKENVEPVCDVIVTDPELDEQVDLHHLAVKTSTPRPSDVRVSRSSQRRSRSHTHDGTRKSHVTADVSWDGFSDDVGHVLYTIQSYESIKNLHGDVIEENDPTLTRKFLATMKNVMNDIGRLQTNILDLEQSLHKTAETSRDQILLLEEEMETELRLKEEKVREEERTRADVTSGVIKRKYETQIRQLEEAVDQLKKVDEKLSNSTPLEKEMQILREKFLDVSTENSTLKTKLSEAETQIVLLRSEISGLQVDLQEMNIQRDRETEEAEIALNDREFMSRHVHSLSSDNRKLMDSNDDLRVLLESNMAAYRRVTKMGRSPTPSYIGDNYFRNENIYSRPSSRNSYLDMETLAECDPCHQKSSCDVTDGFDDDVTDISLDSEWEHSIARGGRKGSAGFLTDSSRRSGSRHSRRSRANSRMRSKANDVTGDDSDSPTSEKKSKFDVTPEHQRKIITPDFPEAKGKSFKVILCGDVNVGKSSFILRVCRNEFKHTTRSTLGVDFHHRAVRLGDGRIADLQLWDSAGQERFRSISTSYFRRADGIILLYDVTNTDSFINVREWMETISNLAREGIPVMICGNKADLRPHVDNGKKTTVFPIEGAQLAASYGVLFMEVSAASGLNILTSVTLLARHILSNDTKDDTGSIKDLNMTSQNDTKCCIQP